jgi:hypothetical protein
MRQSRANIDEKSHFIPILRSTRPVIIYEGAACQGPCFKP